MGKIVERPKEGCAGGAARGEDCRLLGAAGVLSGAEWQSRLRGRRIGWPVKCYGETDSTNLRAKALAEEGAPEGTLVIAESQTEGRGRRGRSWVSPPGEGLWFSFILRPAVVPAAAPAITLTAALAAASGIGDMTGLAPGIKWPNDIVLGGRKLVGILTELAAVDGRVRYVVVGIGINVNIAEFPAEISRTATSLYLETGRRWDRPDLLAAVMKRMEEYYAEYLKTGDMSGLMEEYGARLVSRGEEVMVLAPRNEHRGICEGIDGQGRMLVRLEDGSEERVMSGEVSVRGIYGYV